MILKITCQRSLGVALFLLAISAQAAGVKFQAESGTLGSGWTNGTDGGVQYISTSSSASGGNPTNSTRVATYTVTFPAAGTYDLYVRLRVGTGAASDDSFFYANGFGAKTPNSDADWILCNNLNAVGYTAAADVVDGGGSAGSQVWKWINVSEFNGGEAPITFTVNPGNLNQTFQIASREDGLWIDALVFGTSDYTFTVADLDAGAGGKPPPTGGAPCTVNWNDLRQRIDGFGASSAWRSTWTNAQADMFFSTNSGTATAKSGTNFSFTGIGLSLLRTRISPGGGTVEQNLMQMAQSRGARVWSAPWTPPPSFKDSGVNNGGHFLGGAATNQAYATQLASYVLNMKNTYGVNLYAISVQNEPDGDHPDPGGYESCVWTAQQIHDFIPYLYSALSNNGVGATKILIPESENWKFQLATNSMNDIVTSNLVGILAGHAYGSTASAVNNYGKALWETEDSILTGSDSSINNGIYWAQEIHNFMTVAEANAWHYWWLITANSTGNQGLADTEWVPAKRMYTVGNFSRFVRPDYYRVTVNNSPGTAISAYRNLTNGHFAIVAINSNSIPTNIVFNLAGFLAVNSVVPWVTSASLSLASQPALTVSNASFTYALPAQSVVTFTGAASTNSAPTDLTLSNTSLAENQFSGASVGTLSTTDSDVGDAFTYSLVSGTGSTDNGAFSISGNSLLSVILIDYEAQNSFSIRIRSTDQGGLFVEKVFVITVTNVNEAPSLTPIPDRTLNAGVSLTITNVATDPELPAQTLTFSLLAGPTNATLNSSNGVFTWRPLVRQADTTHLITVKVADDGTPALSATNDFHVTVNPLAQPSLGAPSPIGGQTRMMATGALGPDYTLLTSTNLTNWQAVLTTNPTGMPFVLVDTNQTDAARFYRIQLGP